MDEGSISMLNTPIKKIRNLTLYSPGSVSPIRYPSMSDFPMAQDPICESMIEKGYSQTLSNAVLKELDTRAQQISSNVALSCSASKPMSANRKRYSGVHRPLFSKMDSISSHYAASRQTEHKHQDITSSATKKRRTLNGPEEIFFSSSDDPSPTRRKAPANSDSMNDSLSRPSRQNAHNLSNDLFSGRLQPLKLNVPLTASSPGKRAPVSTTSPSTSLKSSPIKTPGISPSKGSMNLHGLLSSENTFAKPEGPVRIRQSSLQMAGVKPSEGNIPGLSRKTSSNDLQHRNFSLQKKPSVEGLNQKVSTNVLRNKQSFSSLNKKPSVSNLQKKPSIPNLQQKPSFPNLQKKPSFPNLQKKPSIPNLKTPSVSNLSNKTSIPSLQKKPSIPSFGSGTKEHNTSSISHNHHGPSSSFQNGHHLSSSHKNTTVNNTNSAETRTPTAIPRLEPSRSSSRNFSFSSKLSPPQAPQGAMSRSPKANVTIPQPFSLYSKPTISSSQKTFGSQNSLNSAMSNTSSASQRSLNRFQKFKSRFS